MKKLILAIALLSVSSWAQSVYQGAGNVQGQITFGPPITPPPPPTSDEDAYCGLGDVPIGTGVDGPATLPTSCIHTGLDGSPSLGATINAPDTASLAAALTSAACGDKIVLTAGVLYQGPFTIPDKSCNAGQWITIKSTGVADSSFPAEGVRATPCEIGIGVPGPVGYPPYSCANAAVRMAIIETTANGTGSALTFAAGADHYRFIGIAMRKQPGSQKINRKIVDLSNGTDHVIFDRSLCYGEAWKAVPEADDESQGCFAINNSTYFAFVNGWAYDTYCMGTCTDSAAFAGAGTGSLTPLGPGKIYNSLMATAGESFLFGGGGNFPSATAAAHDFEIRRNHSFKPLTWMLPVAGSGVSADLHVINKNLGELKNGDRFLIEGNVFENSWHGWQTDQTGNAMVLGPKNQNNRQAVTVNISGSTVTSSTATADFDNDMVVSGPSCTPPGTAPHYCGCPVDPADGIRRCAFIINDSTRSDDAAVYRMSTVAADLKSATLSTVTTGGNGTSIGAYACHPGDAPDAYIKNLVIRYNWVRNTTNGFQIATAVSFCKDEANGLDTIVAHDNVFDGLEDTMSNGNGPNIQARGFDVGNGVYGSPIKNVTIAHNVVTILHAGQASVSGLMKDGDAHNGETILRGYDIRDNIASGGIVTVSGQGARITGGPLTGLNVHHCVTHTNTYTAGGTVPAGSLPDPTLVGSEPNCSWSVNRNLFGINQWFGQNDQTPTNYPASNQQCGVSGATCFLDGAAYGAIFTNFNGGYLGDYHLAGNTYKGQATDGTDLGPDLDALNLKIAGVAPPPLVGTLSISTTSLPSVGVNNPYPLTTLTASNVNSPFKEWTLASGSLPAGITISRGGRVAWMGITNVKRAANLVTLTAPEDVNAGAFVVGQTFIVEGLVNGTAPADTDASLNGTYTLVSASAGGLFTFNKTGADITTHAINTLATMRFAPTTAGASSFTVRARDGAKQTATQALTLTVTGGVSHSVDLSWSVSTTPGTTTRVYRSTTSGTFAGVAIGTGLTGTTFTDSTVANATTYFYIIRSFDGSNESSNSNQVTAVIP